MGDKKQLRCAVYTRVSTDNGLEQDFNSLDAQREAAEAYIKSQAHEGWSLIRTPYDDGGFSGGSLNRPALQMLLNAVRDRKVDVIVVYKVDRLTRSLADFAKLVELFDQYGASFVSVTQAFNTTTSMGRLTLNVLLSFAQFEREVTAERIRDKIGASKKKGIWVGGVPPFGYRVENRRLVIDPDEAKTVRRIFHRYVALGSLNPLLQELHRTKVKTRKRTQSSGKEVGGIPFGRGALNALLRNRTYLGELNHHGKSYPAEHEAILDTKLFSSVQALIAENARDYRASRVPNKAPLEGILFDNLGNRLSPTYSKKGGVRYRYYTCRLLYEGRGEEAGPVRRVAAVALENTVVSALRQFKLLAAQDVETGIANLRSIVKKVTVHEDHIVISAELADERREIRAAWVPRRGRARREILLPHKTPGKDNRPIRNETRAGVVKAVAQGRTWLAELLSDKGLTIEAIATREGRSARSVQMLLSLNFVAPTIVSALIAGKLPRGIGITKLTHLPLDWDIQREKLGLAG